MKIKRISGYLGLLIPGVLGTFVTIPVSQAQQESAPGAAASVATLDPAAAVPGDALASSEESLGKVVYSNPVNDSKFTISDGSRIDLAEKGLSIAPPSGWEVHLNYPNTTLLMQYPYEKGMTYQRTIQVMRFKGALPIDEVTGQEFEKVIEQKFNKVQGSIADYRMRNHMVTKVADGTTAILYYSEFTMDSTAIMQAHILMSSATHHYLLTYTDLADHFEGEQAGQYLTTAWESMVSVKLDSAAPMRLRLPVILGIGTGLIVLLILFALTFRKFLAGREYKELLGNPYDDSQEASHSGIAASGVGAAPSDVVSRVASFSGRGPSRRRKELAHSHHEEPADDDQDENGWNLSRSAEADVSDLDDHEESDVHDKAG